MTLTIIDHEQGSPDWFQARLGLPTASEFGTVLAKGKNGGESLTRARYLRTLAAEIITGEPGEAFESDAMRRGKIMEDEARKFYAFVHDAEPERVGFIRNGSKGCSPDALIGTEGMLEIKTKRGDILIDVLLRDDLPSEHKAQCQGSLWVAEREFIDFCAYWPGLPLFVKRCYRDEPYIDTLAREIDRFNDELAEITERVRRYGMPFSAQLAGEAATTISVTDGLRTGGGRLSSRAPARIPRAVVAAKRKPNPKRATQHLAFVREIGICLACGARGPVEAAHVRRGTDGGIGVKPSDKYSVPLDSSCHMTQHRVGEVTFWGNLGIDPLNISLRLWTVSGDAEAGSRVIERSLLTRGLASALETPGSA